MSERLSSIPWAKQKVVVHGGGKNYLSLHHFWTHLPYGGKFFVTTAFAVRRQSANKNHAARIALVAPSRVGHRRERRPAIEVLTQFIILSHPRPPLGWRRRSVTSGMRSIRETCLLVATTCLGVSVPAENRDALIINININIDLNFIIDVLDNYHDRHAEYASPSTPPPLRARRGVSSQSPASWKEA